MVPGALPADPYAEQRARLVELSGSSNARVASRAKAALSQLPKAPGQLLPEQRYVPVGPNVFDRVTQTYITPPARVAAAGEPAREAAAKPAAPLRLRPGESLVSPTGQVVYTAPAASARAEGAAPAAAGPKPTAAQVAKAEAQTQARAALSQDLQTVLGYYEQLNTMGGMVSPERTAAENIIASARTSGPGQVAERTVGTKAQTLRDNISNSRQRLLSHIKNATGASAQQMNSNVELQTWLNALTNPSQSIETVRETLGQLDSVISGVRNQIEREARSGAGRPSAAPATAPAPAAGNRREIAPGVFVTERP
jgi:hypothetical protein